MTRVFLGIGSNIDRETYIGAGLDALDDSYGLVGLSPVYESAAIGFEGDPFLNLVVLIETALSVGALAGQLRELEYRMGRPRDATRYSARTLDIDLLTYGDNVGLIEGVQLPREEIEHNAFVLRPLAELAPDDRHPITGDDYAAMWAAYPDASQPLRRVRLHWRGREL